MNALVALNASATVYSPAQLKLIKDTVAKDCNNDEFNLFVTVARNAGLDPFRKQISAIVFNKDDPKKRRMSIITTIDGLRTIAARSRRYRPDEEEAMIEYDPSLKGPLNPLGIVKAVVKIYIADTQRDGGWKPVSGVAYWDEFAPIRDEWAWNDEKGKRLPTGNSQLDGNWPKMGRIMICKCAEAQALRKAFPEDTSGLYEAAELDRAALVDVTPSDAIENLQTQERLARVNGGGILFQFDPHEPIESVQLGKVADRISEFLRDVSGAAKLTWFESVNAQPLKEFWARSKGEALEIKREIDKARARLAAADQQFMAENAA